MFNTACPIVCYGIPILWGLVASGLLLLSWNKVVVPLSNVKAAKYWQALLIVVTLAVVCFAPKMMMKKSSHYGHWNKKCTGSTCPYSKNSSNDSKSADTQETSDK